MLQGPASGLNGSVLARVWGSGSASRGQVSF